ncbi:MAG: tRNA preQ1(34) S-adenosylmethionine ribosyltransferase-isomerase QueA [Candidatus Magasanikbacteria bacterium RIFCSPHIGHO2_01_FULL_41_23]|uniref:S-adenosylmethionine:tRNA ribosyltransferase-isomerase n=1 Tax=Candidatus Magasanikbacteria bacterium RIFCSPLOWO2_01_FULL_40_15 TaxID=1798686 RepID=A0A1F6N4X6_9BACT|nr:MAG: tRNA preQ1(34) S-adenosylmethionine ribosyltransferase-isomerase QueA [Candidatus Magasanikbacteria bacterium RIFCSPHIGHO2_01_FULL_41_23]OGH67166.1 MAG: tRNA preQ1(34) S-adenosylmethionine ribosyltransferase-isomerase QueA [Candidatus Magasanikbacteria bacterium RIFCSPHIGHO2_02_FULL_41_35]OGH75469.1 MAG: tRNA preQ1(34) S-adenosylmethionine ribosyltransferase-isomerase QueA [Candidatus Magasanikbacteria bacterium RIFCSPHIGHO2_12_FULL_41_16]OGH78703.1 MAG: tRNA preQ1(34) S-adenosylmethioni
MFTADFDYNLPTRLIAQKPVEPRDVSRLMIVDRAQKSTTHKHFFDIVDYFQSGDLLVWNNSKVFKARLSGQLLSEKGEPLRDHTKPVEIFLVRPMENLGVWKVLAKPGRHVKSGTRVQFASDFWCDVIVKENDGTILVQFPDTAEQVRAKANQYGSVPLPPYVKDERHELDVYQTIYAKHEGSVAAPTAGFHFTPELIEKLKNKGVEFAEVTLHVGLGTFLPVKTERIADHTMHSEQVEISQETAESVNKAKHDGRRVIAVGTTTVRTLEGVAQFCAKFSGQKNGNWIEPYHGDLNIFIIPGFTFQVVDALITNFHLPKSTLLMLTAALVGDREFMLSCYRQAVADKYRFYSFGDAMFIY